MTSQETFKRRIRERMAKTGERYTAARRVLVTQASTRRRTWASEPEMPEDKVREATGRGWDDWCDVIEAWDGRSKGHTAIARHLADAYDMNSWWAQGVTIGYERITGLRVLHQMTDGSFAASKSKTLDIDVTMLRELLIDDEARRDLIVGYDTVLRSKPTSKALRIGFEEGSALFSFDAAANGRTRITVTQEKLTSAEAADRWRFYWTDWLDALAESD